MALRILLHSILHIATLLILPSAATLDADHNMTLPRHLIALEEHTSIESLGVGDSLRQTILKSFGDVESLRDLGEGRITAMDEGHVTLQVLSQISVGDTTVAGCQAANNELAKAVESHPSRFRSFAVLPMAHPTEAAKELERAVQQLGFVGALIDNTLNNGTTYDDERFWPVFEAAERLDVPIYLHPSPPPSDRFQEQYQGNYENSVAVRLATAAWGWHVNTGLHILKLYAAGLFSRHPKLKIILGHNGELLPSFIDRIDRQRLNTDLNFTEVWNTNIWVTVSGMFTVRMFEMLLKVTNIDRIMYSVDYPFINNNAGWNFVKELGEKGILSQKQMDDFGYQTAARLLKIDLAE